MLLMRRRLRDVKPAISGLEFHLKWPPVYTMQPADVFKQLVTQTHAQYEVLATQVNVPIYTSMCVLHLGTSVRFK